MRFFLLSLIALGALAVAAPIGLRSANERLLRRAALAFCAEDWMGARQIAERLANEECIGPRAAELCTLASARMHDGEAVVAWSRKADDQSGVEQIEPLLAAAEVFVNAGRPHQAEENLRGVLAAAPLHLRARERLAWLLGAEGRTWESAEHLAAIVMSGQFAGEHLVLLGSIQTQLLKAAEFHEACRAANPNDLGHLLPNARVAMFQNRRQSARQALETLLTSEPDHLEAKAWLGRLLAETGDWAAWNAWHAALTAKADAHPETWYARALFARQTGQSRAAARCCWEALRRNPQHLAANNQLAQLLAHEGKTSEADFLARRNRHLAALEDLFRDVANDYSLVPRIVEHLEQLGRYWEAAGWCHLVLRRDSSEGWARDVLRRLHGELSSGAPLVNADADPGQRLDLSNWPLPQFGKLRDSPVMPTQGGASRISFADRAAELGLDFAYYNGADPASGKMRMFEFSGGGVAVLDYDGDLWPDLYLTQGCRWPVDLARREHLDRLFRNLSGKGFAEVSQPAGIEETGFGQGATVADVNNDGFADLYVGNIGPNRLFINQGDGTFVDATETSGTACGEWTTSCVMADFNGDGLPDLFTATYLGGPDVFERRCEHDGKPVQCAPQAFPAADDRLFENLGDGRFAEVTAGSGIEAADGKGLGVVAADFDGSRRLSLFVSNDTTANFFFLNQTQSAGERPSFVEAASVNGLAYDEQGRAQACMGIAAGDADLDGRLDLFVTNFYHESNTLYRQQADGTFGDETRIAQLRDSGFAMLGWGTQFLDADLDGRPDLLVLNGHVNDFSADGIAFEMPPQFFRNLGGRFQEGRAVELGPYFQQRRLGRALARLDWNCDGREDACATHVDRPLALLGNQTPTDRHYLAVRLVGVASSRDAIGATVRLSAGQKTFSMQLTAGDGYQASNERQLVFGLGAAGHVDELTVDWPSGRRDVFLEIPVDQRLIVCEGSAAPLRLPD